MYAICQTILLDAQVPGGKCDILRILWGGHCLQTWNLHEFFYNMLPRMLASDCSCLQVEGVSHTHAHTSFRGTSWSCCTIFPRIPRFTQKHLNIEPTGLCVCVHRFNKRFNCHDAGGARDHCKSGTDKNACFDLWYQKGTPFWRTCSFETVHQAVAARLFRYTLTGSMSDLPEFIVSNVPTSRCQTRSFQCARAGRQLRTLGDDSDITRKFH